MTGVFCFFLLICTYIYGFLYTYNARCFINQPFYYVGFELTTLCQVLFFQFTDDDGMCCSSTEQQATGYVLMAGRSEYLIAANDPLGSGVNHSTDQNRRDTDSLLRQVRDKVRSRRTSSGDSADHSSEQDSSENCESIILHPSNNFTKYTRVSLSGRFWPLYS